jgi:hypothetical protein
MTWLRRDPSIVWLDARHPEELTTAATEAVRRFLLY